MRQIKFRAWDNSMKTMVTIKPFSSKHQVMTWDGLVYENGKLQDFTMMQFTGLFDKNGKEIYEGDIVLRSNDAFGYVRFGFDGVKVSWKRAGDLKSKKTGFTQVGLRHGKTMEIIGNIYESPHLLNAEDKK